MSHRVKKSLWVLAVVLVVALGVLLAWPLMVRDMRAIADWWSSP